MARERALSLASLLVLCVGAEVDGTAQRSDRTDDAVKVHAFTVTQPSAVVAKLTVRCDRCAWEVEGREAAVLTVALDASETSFLPLVRTGRAEYRVLLGFLDKGTRTLRVGNSAYSARELRARDAVTVENIEIEQIAGREGFILSLAPQLYARPDTIGRFTDVPVFMWYEEEKTANGTRYRFSVVFTNEDGGTPADRLMATWGRTTDIEYVYSVEVDAKGQLLGQDFQGPEHKVLPFRGRRDGTHPQLYVVTENNMVVDEKPAGAVLRFSPAPAAFPLIDVSREAVMDAEPWLYEVMAKELAREGKIVPDAPAGKGVIQDPRRHAYLEGCGVVGDNALTFALRVNDTWISSDRGLPQYRIVRDGCFRAAVPLPAGIVVSDVRSVAVHAHARQGKPPTAPVRFTRLNTLFGLNEHYVPGPPLLQWTGSAELRPGGPPLELAVR